jgi:hypothetical protein
MINCSAEGLRRSIFKVTILCWRLVKREYRWSVEILIENLWITKQIWQKNLVSFVTINWLSTNFDDSNAFVFPFSFNKLQLSFLLLYKLNQPESTYSSSNRSVVTDKFALFERTPTLELLLANIYLFTVYLVLYYWLEIGLNHPFQSIPKNRCSLAL